MVLVASFAPGSLSGISRNLWRHLVFGYTANTEIGIRMALGATAPQVQLGVVAKALRLAIVGIVLGTVGSFAAAKWISSLLFGTT